VIRNQARLLQTFSISDTANLNRSTTHSENSVRYTYDSRLGKLQNANGEGTFVSRDQYGNETTGSTNQTFTIILGQARVAQTTTVSSTRNLDGSSSEQTIVVINDWSDRGVLLGASGSGTTRSDDGFGNITSGTIAQTFDVIAGQAKLTSNISTSETSYVDGSEVQQSITVSYYYDENGVLINASGEGSTLSNDGFDNFTSGSILQEYSILNGQAVVSRSTQMSWTSDSNGTGSYDSPLPDTDGSWTRQSITTEFIYNALGELVAASGFGIGLANDGFVVVPSSEENIMVSDHRVNGHPSGLGLGIESNELSLLPGVAVVP
jgi:hypothetical protein